MRLRLHEELSTNLNSINYSSSNAGQERGFRDTNPKATNIKLHDFAKLLRIYGEHFNALEYRATLIVKVSGTISNATTWQSTPDISTNDIYMLEFLLPDVNPPKTDSQLHR